MTTHDKALDEIAEVVAKLQEVMIGKVPVPRGLAALASLLLMSLDQYQFPVEVTADLKKELFKFSVIMIAVRSEQLMEIQ